MKTRKKVYAWNFIWIMLIQILMPVHAYALTGGPSQPEFSGFEPIGTTEMVNLPSGDFQYNIPLMDVGGYPLNLAYHSGITADMEASCVGLGWTINPGVINRNVRAIPDDFKGADDGIVKEFNMKDNITIGTGVDVSDIELFGKNLKKLKLSGGLSLNMGVFYNNYWGLGYEFGLTPSFSAGAKGFGKLTAGMGMSANSRNGANFSPSLSYSKVIDDNGKMRRLDSKIGLSVNSRDGLEALKFSSSDGGFLASKSSALSLIGVGSGSANYSYATKTFIPNISMPQNNLSLSLSYKMAPGTAFYGSAVSLAFSGYVSRQSLRDKLVTKSPYGLLYADNGYEDDNALMDFNREKDNAFHDYSINLPVVVSGGDVLSLAGQGIGGSFKLKRSDVPMFFDAKSTAVSNGGNFGFEAGAGGVFHGGADIKYNHTKSVSGKWKTDNNSLLGKYNFSHTSSPGYEKAYYKAAGEMAVESDDEYYKNIGEDRAVRADLGKPGLLTPFKVPTEAFLIDENYNRVTPTSGKVKRKHRERRNNVISYLTAKEANQYGLEKGIRSYRLNDFNYDNNSSSTTSRVSSSEGKQDHHISQIESIRSDGLRYIYGIPAYNLSKKEVSFNVSGRIPDCDTGDVIYNAGDDSRNNSLGKDHYFSSVETPAYAHSYLLTAVLSQDYEDQGMDGPSDDDYGSYTRINYAKTTDSNGNVSQWRTPVDQNSANYNAGLFSESDDDKGTYIYGKKEIWLVHSVESKTMIAEFTYSKRQDAFGVAGKDGGIATNNFNRKLDKLTLYSKPDRLNNGIDATPIKVVHFEYNYELCPETPNSKVSAENPHRGKLSLKKLYFTYGHSKKGRLSSYQFEYKNTGDADSKYDGKSYDRWGSFKLNNINQNCDRPRPGDLISNDEYPYVDQNNSNINDHAGTWSLNNIMLPSGGRIDIDYVAKHYAYVQDRPAMEMVKIIGAKGINDGTVYDQNNQYMTLYLDLNGHSMEDYLKEIEIKKDYVYLRCFVRMNRGLLLKERWEYVSLYAKIEKYGSNWIKLEPLKDGDDDGSLSLNPISKYSFQFIREHMPAVAYDQSSVKAEDLMSNPLNQLKPIISMTSQLISFVAGYNRVMKSRGYANKIDVKGRSYIRLNTPDGVKIGGGSVVSQIKIHDNWGLMTGDPSNDFSYGQEYEYTKLDQSTGKLISSGVASYEPQIGGDENPFRLPVEVVSQERKWAVDNVHFIEEPFGEAFMPAPQVVFSEIKVRNLQYHQPGLDVTRTATGHSLMKYYTAQDFPVKNDQTDLQKKPKRVNPILGLLKVKMKEHTNASQGFVMETNNMHGQAQSKEVYDENGTLVSKVAYFYKRKPNGELDNRVSVVNADGKIDSGLLGVDYQLVGDSRQSEAKTISGGVNLNIDGFLASILPVAIPLAWPNYASNERRYRSVSMTKVVNKYGVLDSIVAYDLGSTIATHNLAYDAETGEVLLTKTFNEFEDPVYNLKLPAHLAYEGMQGAYQNIGLTTRITNQGNTGTFRINNLNSTADNPFVPGDELALYSSSGVSSQKAWVLHTVDPGNQFFLIDENGNPITGGYTACKVIRSGHRNMPTASIGSITSKENPITEVNSVRSINGINDSIEILNAGAVEYSEDWQTFCSNENSENCPQSSHINPFVNNVLGNWKPKKSWLHLSERSKKPLASTASHTNIRENGAYTAFSPFWNSNGIDPWKIDYANWIWTTEVTQFNPNGTELENIDKLGRYSAEIVGYANQLVTGVAANSRYRQIAFDGFEDYHYNLGLASNANCPPPKHFGHDIDIQHIDIDNHHTGNYSIITKRGNPVTSIYKIEDHCPPNPSLNTSKTIPYTLDDCNCIQSFSPDPGKYVVTAWVKEGSGLGATNYNKHTLRINTKDNSLGSNTIINAFPFKASGAIIEGWQRIEGTFDIMPNATDLEVIFESSNNTEDVYFDDLRIFPFDGDMKNFVYHDVSLKLLSEIDANGYANFYEYDLSGELIRIKKETERGIMTIQESRSSQPKQ